MRLLAVVLVLLTLGADYPRHRRFLQRSIPTAQTADPGETLTTALAFDSAADVLDITSGVPSSHLYSAKAWVYLKSPRPAYDTWVNLTSAGGTSYAVWGTDADGLTHEVFQSAPWAFAGQLLVADGWFFVFVVFDSTGGTLYSKPLGGVIQKTRHNENPGTFTPVRLSMGLALGRLRGVAVWGSSVTSWTDQQVADESAQFAPVRTTGLYGYWRLATVAGKLVDLSGNGHTLANPGGAGTWAEEAAPAGIPESL